MRPNQQFGIVSIFLCLALTGCEPPKATTTPIGSSTSTTPVPPPTTSPTPPPSGGTSKSLPPGVTNDFKKAQAQVERTIASQPNDHNLRMRAAEFYMRVGYYPPAIPHLQKAVQLAPDRVLAWVALGDAASLSGKFDIAEKAYAEGAKRDAKNPFIARGQGQMYLIQKRFALARTVLEEGLKANPGNVEIRSTLGHVYLILNKPRLTIATVKPALEKEPNRPDLHYLIGDAYERDLHIETAIKHMQNTVRLDPSSAEAWGRIGLYQVNLTRYKEARDPLQRAIQLRPNEPHFYWALGDSYLLDDTEPERFKKAKELYRTSLKLAPNNIKALYSYGMGLTRFGDTKDLEEALDVFQRLIKANPKDMNAHYKLYETYKRLGRTAEAEAHRTKFKTLFAAGRNQTRSLYAKAAFKDTAEVHLKLGNQAMKQKNYDLAATEFQMALERDSNLEAAREGLRSAQKFLNK